MYKGHMEKTKGGQDQGWGGGGKIGTTVLEQQ